MTDPRFPFDVDTLADLPRHDKPVRFGDAVLLWAVAALALVALAGVSVLNTNNGPGSQHARPSTHAPGGGP